MVQKVVARIRTEDVDVFDLARQAASGMPGDRTAAYLLRTVISEMSNAVRDTLLAPYCVYCLGCGGIGGNRVSDIGGFAVVQTTRRPDFDSLGSALFCGALCHFCANEDIDVVVERIRVFLKFDASELVGGFDYKGLFPPKIAVSMAPKSP